MPNSTNSPERSELDQLIALIRSVVDEPDRATLRLSEEYRRRHQLTTARRARLDAESAEILRTYAPHLAP